MYVIKHEEDMYLFQPNGEVYKFDFVNLAWKLVVQVA